MSLFLKQDKRSLLRKGLCGLLCLVLLMGNLAPALALEGDPDDPETIQNGTADGRQDGAGGSSDTPDPEPDPDLDPDLDLDPDPDPEPDPTPKTYTLTIHHVLSFGTEGQSVTATETRTLEETGFPAEGLDVSGLAHTYNHTALTGADPATLNPGDFGETLTASAVISYQAEEGYEAIREGETISVVPVTQPEPVEYTLHLLHVFHFLEDGAEKTLEAGETVTLDSVPESAEGYIRPFAHIQRTEADTLSREDFGEDLAAQAEIHYQLEEGYIAQVGSANPSGMRKARAAAPVSVNDINIVAQSADTGTLTVTNTVGGTGAEEDRTFHFKVELGDKTIMGDYGEVAFTSGVAIFELKDGASKTIQLPDGMTYTVTQTDNNIDGYKTIKTGDTGTTAKDTPATAAFTNTRDGVRGSLVVRNVVTGSSAEQNRDFHFQVTLSDKTINGTYGQMEFKNGVAAFTLQGGKGKNAQGLPVDTTYTVTETESGRDGYTTQATGATGTIREAVLTTAAFTNTRDGDRGDLTVTNTIKGSSAEKTREFRFQVTLTGTPAISGVYGDMEFKDGKASFTLKDGESKTAVGLPAGTVYTVTQTEENRDGYVTTKAEATGTIAKDATKTAAFTNTKENRGNLRVSLTITGYKADKTKEIKFKVLVNDLPDGVYGDLEFKDCESVFTLTDGESVDIQGLPAGSKYKVTQETISGYRVTKYLDEGTIQKDQTTRCRFTDRKTNLDYTYKTGDDSNVGLWLGLAGVFLVIGIGAMTFSRRRKNR